MNERDEDEDEVVDFQLTRKSKDAIPVVQPKTSPQASSTGSAKTLKKAFEEPSSVEQKKAATLADPTNMFYGTLGPSKGGTTGSIGFLGLVEQPSDKTTDKRCSTVD